jgi:hypothetical protein
MNRREAVVAEVLADRVSDHPMWDGVDYTGERESKIAAFVYDTAAAIVAALDTPAPAPESGAYPCCGQCDPGCSGRHENPCPRCQTPAVRATGDMSRPGQASPPRPLGPPPADLIAIADEGAARARGVI